VFTRWLFWDYEFAAEQISIEMVQWFWRIQIVSSDHPILLFPSPSCKAGQVYASSHFLGRHRINTDSDILHKEPGNTFQ
jgi:hypothetical protein